MRPVARGTPRCASCKRALPWLVEVGEDFFEREVTASVPVVIDLWEDGKEVDRLTGAAPREALVEWLDRASATS